MNDEYEDFDEWGSSPTLELTQKSIDYELLLWQSGDSYQIMVWEREGMGNEFKAGYSEKEYEDALHCFAVVMNELEMY